MGCCNPDSTLCPFCFTSNSVYTYLHKEAVSYLPMLTSSFILIDLNTLLDQDTIKTVYHPPTFNL
jgi:hypothetical protein